LNGGIVSVSWQGDACSVAELDQFGLSGGSIRLSVDCGTGDDGELGTGGVEDTVEGTVGGNAGGVEGGGDIRDSWVTSTREGNSGNSASLTSITTGG